MKKSLVYIFTLLIVYGCRQQKAHLSDNGAEIIEIPNPVELSIVDIAEQYSYVTLHVNDNVDAALGTISNLRVFGDKIYVMDNFFTNKLLIFDKDGTFLKKVSRHGRGPQEYVELSTFEIDYLKEEILIKDESGEKILFFDTEGQFLRSIPTYIRGEGIAVLRNGNMTHGIDANWRGGPKETKNYKLIITDQEGNIIDKYVEDRIKLLFGFSSRNLMNPSFDGNVTFAPQLMNCIYRISEQGVEGIYSIMFPDPVDRDKLSKLNAAEYRESELSKKPLFRGNHADSDDYFYLVYGNGNDRSHVFYNKKDRSVFTTNDPKCGTCVTVDELGNFWGALSEATIYKDQSPVGIEITEAIRQSENPVVVCYTLK